MQQKSEWYEQWELLQCNELFLFKDWIYPATLKDFRGKDVLECGCGGGQHTSFVSPFAKSVTAVDLNTVDIAKERNTKFSNINFVQDDIAHMKLRKKFDVVFSIGVVHHTDDPETTVHNLVEHTKPGGKLILWIYSKEGNFLSEYLVEPIRKKFLTDISRKKLLMLSRIVTFFLYIPIYSIYLMPLSFLPYYKYFKNFRKLSFHRNALNVFDKLNAPQTQFISRNRATNWFAGNKFSDVQISAYRGVSWRICGVKL